MASEDAIKDAFLKIKQDILELRYEFNEIKHEIQELNSKLDNISMQNSIIPAQNFNMPSQDFNTPTHPAQTPKTPTDIQQIGENTEQFQHIFDRYKPYLPNSIGNEGVPTDKQTDNQQTNRQDFKGELKQESFADKTNDLMNLVSGLKEEVRKSFLKLTKQEFFIFSVMYELDDKGLVLTYPLIAERTKLTESSIRDYIGRLIDKGIPIEKQKINNKQIIVKIKEELKKLTTLDSLVKMREFKEINEFSRDKL